MQRQLWQETSGAAYTSTRASALSQLDQLYGAPGSANALDSIYNNFTSSLQALQNDPVQLQPAFRRARLQPRSLPAA